MMDGNANYFFLSEFMLNSHDSYPDLGTFLREEWEQGFWRGGMLTTSSFFLIHGKRGMYLKLGMEAI